MSPADTRRDERGSAVVVSLLLMTLFLILGGAFLSTSLTDSMIAGNQVSATRAFHLAEAGVAHARAIIDVASIDSALSGDGVLLRDHPLGTGSYTVLVSNNISPQFPLGEVGVDAAGPDVDSDGYVVVTSIGQFRHASSTVRVVLHGREQPWANWGVFSTGLFSAHGAGTITGQVGANSNMFLSSDIIGDATAGRTIDYPARVSGTATEWAPRVRFQGVLCPETGFGPAPSGPGVSFNPISGDLIISGSSDVVLPSGAYYFNKVSKTGSGQLRVPVGASVQLYVESDLLIEDEGIRNENDSADNLILFGCSDQAGMLSGAPEWRVAPSTDFYATVYAPSHRLRLYGEGDQYGAYVGTQFTKIGRGNVIHQSTSSGTTGGAFDIVRGTWTTP